MRKLLGLFFVVSLGFGFTAQAAEPDLITTVTGSASKLIFGGEPLPGDAALLREKAHAQATSICLRLLGEKASTKVTKDEGAKRGRGAQWKEYIYALEMTARLENPDPTVMIPRLVGLLKLGGHEPLDYQTAVHAQELLATIGDRTIPALIAALDTNNVNQRIGVMGVFGRFVERDDSIYPRRGALPFSPQTNLKIEESVVALLKDLRGDGLGTLSVSENARSFLSELKGVQPITVNALISLVRDEKKIGARTAAVRVLDALASSLGENTGPVIRVLVAALQERLDTNDETAKFHSAVVAALSNVGKPAAPSVVEVMRRHPNPNDAIGKMAAQALVKMVQVQHSPEILRRLLEFKDPNLTWWAAVGVKQLLFKSGKKALGNETTAIATLLAEAASSFQARVANSDANPAILSLQALQDIGPAAIHTVPVVVALFDVDGFFTPENSSIAAEALYAIAKIARATEAGKKALPRVKYFAKQIDGWYFGPRPVTGPHEAVLAKHSVEILEGKRDPEKD